MASSALSPVASGIFAALQTTAMDTALAGGWHADVPPKPTYPFGWIETFDERDRRGLGTGELPEIEVRLHVFAQASTTIGGFQQAQAATRVMKGLLRDATVTIDGYRQCGHLTFRSTVQLSDQELNGVKVHEIVSTFTVWAEV